MVTVDQVLSHYFNFTFHKNHQRQEMIDEMKAQKDDPGRKNVVSDVYGVRGRIDLVMPEHRGTGVKLIIYQADKEIRITSDAMANAPVNQIPDCEYMYYGMYLNILGYLSELNVSGLFVVHSKWDQETISYRNRPEIAQLVLDHFVHNHSGNYSFKETPTKLLRTQYALSI